MGADPGSTTATSLSTHMNGCATRTALKHRLPEAENDYTERTTAHLEPLRQKIFHEIKARTKETDYRCRRDVAPVVLTRGPLRESSGVHCRCPVTDPDDWNPPEFDERTEIPGEQLRSTRTWKLTATTSFALGAASVSLDDNLAYSVDVG